MNAGSRLAAAALLTCWACQPVGPDLLEDQPRQTTPVEIPLPAIDGAPVAAPVAPAAAPAAAPEGEANPVRWQTPDGWEEQPPSNTMRVAQWASPDGADCALFNFPGGGGTEQNITRWVGQFQQPDGSDSMERAERMQITVEGVPVTLVRVSGTFETRNPPMTGPVVREENHAMFAAIFERPGSPYFLKCTGPAEIIAQSATEISQFVASFRFL